MKKQNFSSVQLSEEKILKILGGITDPNNESNLGGYTEDKKK